MIEVKGLSKSYGTFKAVDDASLVSKDGKITILIGPNGAGKSTTIKSIAGLLKYTGDITIDGFDNKTMEAKKSFGYIPEVPNLYEKLTIQEHVNFIMKAYKVQDEGYVDELISLFDLEEKRNTVVKNLSKGMLQKVSMMMALLHRPTSLMIDEPMIGLDPMAIENVLRLLVEYKHQGSSILISTHIIDVIEEVYDEAYIMLKGKIVKHIVKEELKDQSLKEIFFQCVEDSENERT